MNPMTKRKKIFGVIGLLLLLTILILRLLSTFKGPTTQHVSVIRTIHAAEATYYTAYPSVGYAPNLLALGPAYSGNCDSSHDCLLDNVVACSSGTGQGWCMKNLYRYNLQSSSNKPPYTDYWVTATPVDMSSKLRSYCSLSNTEVRAEQVAPLSQPYMLKECRSLPLATASELP
jgi:hypothetical protein